MTRIKNADDAITGIKITFTWTSGTKKGTGVMKSYRETMVAGSMFTKEGEKTTDFLEVKIIL